LNKEWISKIRNLQADKEELRLFFFCMDFMMSTSVSKYTLRGYNKRNVSGRDSYVF